MSLLNCTLSTSIGGKGIKAFMFETGLLSDLTAWRICQVLIVQIVWIITNNFQVIFYFEREVSEVNALVCYVS